MTFSRSFSNMIIVINFSERSMQKMAYKTKQQDLLVSYLKTTQGRHFTVDDVRLYFAGKDSSIGVATIYRRLEKLVSEGVVQKYFLGDQTAACFEYTGGDSNTNGNHFHLKCEKCGKLVHLETDDLKEVCSQLKQEHGFSLDSAKTVLYGVCSECTETKESRAGKQRNE